MKHTPTTYPGMPYPLGASFTKERVNFALFVQRAESVVLQLFDNAESLFWQHVLDPDQNQSGHIWHIALENVPRQSFYRFLVKREGVEIPLLDPYAKELSGQRRWKKKKKESLKARLPPSNQPSFSWQGDRFLNHPLHELIIYEMHVRGFTQHANSHAHHRGCFLGIVEKIPHLKELGVNAVELLPVTYFDEEEKGPALLGLCNYWGYSPISFFALMNRYATTSAEVIEEFKMMVKELHAAGIEVILDLVFNHTAEGNNGPFYSLMGLAWQVYYQNFQNKILDYTGCGNTLNANHPVNIELILCALRYFACEFHVDGFRFDLASALTRGSGGQPMQNPPLIEAISQDPLLSQLKLIAEPWDAGGLYQLGFFPKFGNWSEWNGRFRDDVRQFIKGTPGFAGLFATRICGSSDLYSYSLRGPACSINFITCHDGFTLADLVSYNEKHNAGNAEKNRDGLSCNLSWNCGAEGPSDDPAILALRQKQMRNHHLALMVSQGVPMVMMGDEYAHSKNGNNNTWCQDNILNWFDWQKLRERPDFFRFYSGLIHFRRRNKDFFHNRFLQQKDIQWHGREPHRPDWGSDNRLVAFSLFDKKRQMYVAFNASNDNVQLQLPKGHFKRIVDTSLAPPEDFCPEMQAPSWPGKTYLLKVYSALVLLEC